MVPVSYEVFYSYVNPRDVVTESLTEKEHFLRIRGGPIIGKTEGYKSDEKFYCLTQYALDILKKEKENDVPA